MKSIRLKFIIIVYISIFIGYSTSNYVLETTLSSRYDEIKINYNSLKSSKSPLWNYTTDNTVRSVAICSNGTYIAVGSNDKNVYLFNNTSSKPMWNFSTCGNVESVAISSNGMYIAAIGQNISGDNRVYLFHRSSSTPLWYDDTNNWPTVAISADGKYIAVGDIYRVSLYNQTNLLWQSSYLTDEIFSIALSPNGQHIVAGSGHGKILLFNKSMPVPEWDDKDPEWIFDSGGLCSIYGVKFSSDGNKIVAGTFCSHIYKFNRESSVPLLTYDNPFWAVDFSDDGNYIAAGTGNNYIYLFSSQSTTPLWYYEADGPIQSISISSDGSYIVAGSSDKKLYIFHYKSSSPIKTYQAADTWYPVSISSDGKYIVAGSDNYTCLFSDYSYNSSITVDDGIGKNRKDDDEDNKVKDEDNLIYVIIFLLIIGSISTIAATSLYHYRSRNKKTKSIRKIRAQDSNKIMSSSLSSKEILNRLTNKSLLLQIFQIKESKKISDPLDNIDLTAVSKEFLKKLDSIKIEEEEKIEFLKEMLLFSPEERNEILDNILKRLNSYSEGE